VVATDQMMLLAYWCVLSVNRGGAGGWGLDQRVRSQMLAFGPLWRAKVVEQKPCPLPNDPRMCVQGRIQGSTGYCVRGAVACTG
jgi:hypothetical protein